MQDKVDISGLALDVVAIGCGVFLLSEFFIRVNAAITERRRDKAAIDAVDEAFRTPESDARLEELKRKTDELLKSRRSPG